MYNFDPDVYYISIALIMSALVLVVIPREEIKRLFPFCLLWGYGGSFILIKILGHGMLNWFHWKQTPMSFWGSPFLLNLAWVIAIMLFLYLIPKSRHLFWLYYFTFALISAGLEDVFHNMRLVEWIFWSPFHRFILACLWLLAAKYHHDRIYRHN